MTGWLWNSRCRSALCVLLAALTLLTPVLVSAQDTKSVADACFTAQRDAEMNVNKTLWFIAGCGLGVWGILLAYLVSPNPPAINMIGKSPEWVSVYSDCYKDKGKSRQTNTALVGCLVGTAAWVVIYVVIIAAAASTDDNIYY